MTHTVILDEAERDRRFVNHLNEILRHCRIGKVREKLRPAAPRIADVRKPTPIFPSWPFDTPNPPTPMFMDKCGCRVGSACGNVACPHRMLVVSGRRDVSHPPIIPSYGVVM